VSSTFRCVSRPHPAWRAASSPFSTFPPPNHFPAPAGMNEHKRKHRDQALPIPAAGHNKVHHNCRSALHSSKALRFSSSPPLLSPPFPFPFHLLLSLIICFRPPSAPSSLPSPPTLRLPPPPFPPFPLLTLLPPLSARSTFKKKTKSIHSNSIHKKQKTKTISVN